jgi:UDP-3-O-[3-hydroxymyristoyl] glucosamine N-acyltransferase
LQVIERGRVIMEHPGFFEVAGPFTLAEVARVTESQLAPGVDGQRVLTDVRPLADAGSGHLSFLDNKKYLPQLATTGAGACLVQPAFAERLPAGAAALLTKAPYRGFALALALFYPQAMRPQVAPGAGRDAVHPSARIESGAEIQPGAIIGAEAEVGRGTVIAAGAVVGYRCTIGRDSFVGAGASVTHALIGDRVIVHAGARIGQDGFGFAMGARGHLKVPQIGRVIIQDDVEIGANTCIDRGALKDTIIGEGSKIDNLVQIGHNVIMGRHCVIVGQCGIAGSAELGDFVVMGGQAGVGGHIKIGAGVHIAGGSHAIDDVPAGARLVGTPARPLRQWIKEQAVVRRLGPAAERSAEPDE